LYIRGVIRGRKSTPKKSLQTQKTVSKPPTYSFLHTVEQYGLDLSLNSPNNLQIAKQIAEQFNLKEGIPFKTCISVSETKDILCEFDGEWLTLDILIDDCDPEDDDSLQYEVVRIKLEYLKSV